MQVNMGTPKTMPRTYEGGPASKIPGVLQLRRSVMSCLLWEDGFYENGEEIGKRISALVKQVPAEIVAQMAIDARTDGKLRHVPLLLVREMARHKSHRPLVAKTLEQIIQRPDELAEFLALYWKDGKQPLASQVKKGLAKAFPKFTEYQLAKYNRDKAVKLRDVLFLSHAKPKDPTQAVIWKQLVDGALQPPDTWEVALSAGKDKRATWTRLITEQKLGALALLRNLRNMSEVGVDTDLIHKAIASMRTERILPFRFIAAARHAPQFEPALERSMLDCVRFKEKLPGKTVVLVDVSGSMKEKLSGKSDMTRLDAACGVAILAREICQEAYVATFSNAVVTIPSRQGFALRDAITSSQPHGGTYLGQALIALQKADYDRIIVITDEQTADRLPNPKGEGKAYIVNVASDKNGIGYEKYVKIDGWSESVIDFIVEFEKFI